MHVHAHLLMTHDFPTAWSPIDMTLILKSLERDDLRPLAAFTALIMLATCDSLKVYILFVP